MSKGKFFLSFFLIVLIVITSVVIFLTYFGLETVRFDNLIKDKANEINRNIKLEFYTKIEALNYVKKNNIKYDIVEPQNAKIIKKTYSDNFLK